MSSPLIRLATPADLPAINSIYNYYVIHSTTTFQTEPSSDEERTAWFAGRGPEYPVTVVEEAGEVVGWGSISRFHPRSAYRPTVEHSVYLRHDRLGRGVGTLLLNDLIDRAGRIGHHSMIGLICADQEASLRLHAKAGFVKVGHLREAGRKFERWLDVIYMQKMLGP